MCQSLLNWPPLSHACHMHAIPWRGVRLNGAAQLQHEQLEQNGEQREYEDLVDGCPIPERRWLTAVTATICTKAQLVAASATAEEAKRGGATAWSVHTFILSEAAQKLKPQRRCSRFSGRTCDYHSSCAVSFCGSPNTTASCSHHGIARQSVSCNSVIAVGSRL